MLMPEPVLFPRVSAAFPAVLENIPGTDARDISIEALDESLAGRMKRHKCREVSMNVFKKRVSNVCVARTLIFIVYATRALISGIDTINVSPSSSLLPLFPLERYSM